MTKDLTSFARLHVTVEGEVQGVGFRYFVIEKAEQLGLKGWVRNRDHGNVEVCAEGSRYDLEQLIQCLQDGPPSANVSHVEIEWLPASGEFTSFWLRSTG
jgi:acylphosphatase